MIYRQTLRITATVGNRVKTSAVDRSTGGSEIHFALQNETFIYIVANYYPNNNTKLLEMDMNNRAAVIIKN